MKDNFSTQAKSYALYRPVYPRELYEYITGFVTEKKLAWDCGTGNGQTAIELSGYFEKVYATDISTKQIENAKMASNVTYAIEPGEHTLLPNDSVDLVTVSQALHWFDFVNFYKEARRVSKPGSIIAAWAYGLSKIDAVTDKIIYDYYHGPLGKFWDEERKYIDDGYQTIPFPFTQINDPGFFIRADWNLEAFTGYLNTWSALQKFIASNKYNPLDELVERIKKTWPADEIRTVIFPLHLKVGYVH